MIGFEYCIVTIIQCLYVIWSLHKMRKLDKKIELYKHIMYFYKDYVDRLETPKIKKLRDKRGRFIGLTKNNKPFEKESKQYD